LPGLVPAIHAAFGWQKAEKEGVDARHKAGQGASLVVSDRSRTTGFAEPDSRGLDPAISGGARDRRVKPGDDVKGTLAPDR